VSKPMLDRSWPRIRAAIDTGPGRPDRSKSTGYAGIRIGVRGFVKDRVDFVQYAEAIGGGHVMCSGFTDAVRGRDGEVCHRLKMPPMVPARWRRRRSLPSCRRSTCDVAGNLAATRLLTERATSRAISCPVESRVRVRDWCQICSRARCRYRSGPRQGRRKAGLPARLGMRCSRSDRPQRRIVDLCKTS